MADKGNNSTSMTLSQLCDVLNISARKVQYLREQNIVVPTVVGVGRGRPCLYTVEDAVLVWVALIELDGMDYEMRRKIILSISEDCSAPIGNFSSISVAMRDIRNKIVGML